MIPGSQNTETFLSNKSITPGPSATCIRLWQPGPCLPVAACTAQAELKAGRDVLLAGSTNRYCYCLGAVLWTMTLQWACTDISQQALTHCYTQRKYITAEAIATPEWTAPTDKVSASPLISTSHTGNSRARHESPPTTQREREGVPIAGVTLTCLTT
jgi:hypothetical protein